MAAAVATMGGGGVSEADLNLDYKLFVIGAKTYWFIIVHDGGFLNCSTVLQMIWQLTNTFWQLKIFPGNWSISIVCTLNILKC